MLKNLVLNLDSRIQFNHHPNLSNSFRMLLVGSSGCGKTTLLFQAVLEPGFIDYDNLIIFTSTPKQQEYQLLYHGFKNKLTKENIASIAVNQAEIRRDYKDASIEDICRLIQQANKSKGEITVTLSNKLDEIPYPDKLQKDKKHLIIFDDCVTQKNQDVMGSYWARSRHAGCNCIYLSQSFFELDRLIRLNSNFLILFKLSQRNRNDIYNQVVGTIMDKAKFAALADNVWSKKHRYLVIDKDRNRIYDDIFTEYEDSSDEDNDL